MNKGCDRVSPVTRFAIDAPTLLELVGNEATVDASHQLVAPNIIRSQALTLLLRAVLRGEMDERAAMELHTRLTELKMRLLGDRVSRRTAWKIASERGWETTYDAEYFAVCQLQADAFVTVDPEMAAAAEGLVTLAPFASLFVA
jgi:predicted nucleic acid-binding protein